MAEFNLKMIKILFIVVIAMLILAMTSGMNILRGEKFSSWEKIKMEANFLKYKRAFAAAKYTAPENSSDAKSVTVLMYHGIIADKKWRDDDTNISLADFQSQMFELKRAGYQTITLANLFDFLKNGKPVPEKSFLLTFDDGRKDSYYPADPILRALDYNAVMFAITGQSLSSKSQNSDFYLTENELREMQKSGRWEIESHGDFDHDWEKISEEDMKGHFLSNRLWLAEPKNRLETEDEAKARVINDLASSKTKLEKKFGKTVLGFAYPFNDYGQESQNFPDVAQFIRENVGKIYPLTFRQVENDDQAANYPNPNQIFVKRLDVNSTVSVGKLLSLLEHNQDKILPYRDTFWDDRGWISRWGKEKIWGDLSLSDEDNEKSGNLTVLTGTNSWENYSFQADFQIERGGSISQIVDYQDDDNYAACNFFVSSVSISEKVNGEERMTVEQSSPIVNFVQNVVNRAQTEAMGNQVSCFLNGVKQIEANISGKPSGGIGFSFWDDLPGASVVSVKKVEVNPLGR